MLFPCKFPFSFYSVFRVLERFEDMLFLPLVPGWAIGVWRVRQDGEGRQELQMTNAHCHPNFLPPLPPYRPLIRSLSKAKAVGALPQTTSSLKDPGSILQLRPGWHCPPPPPGHSQMAQATVLGPQNYSPCFGCLSHALSLICASDQIAVSWESPSLLRLHHFVKTDHRAWEHSHTDALQR